ncbi:MAG TPA: glycoside hydrolase family 16 protein [Anaeromyxobacteraceae bacterium]|jgi:beta-glucanase (GH16 family)|nr:glycoside hydrolase family 16 protein [Anaeromyxobacteraceae bacterium]
MRGRGGFLLAASAALAMGCGLMPPEKPGTTQQSTPTPPPVPGPTQTPSPAPSSGLPSPLPGYHLLWHDEFDGAGLDPTKWTASTGPRRDATLTTDAISVHDGLLTVTTYTDGGKHYTGFLTTGSAFQPTFGYFEARIRFNDAPGEWCAFWLLSPTNGVPLGDPATAGAEVDIVEHRVTDPKGWDALRDLVKEEVHWDGYGADRKDSPEHTVPLAGGGPVQGAWHTYSVLWTDAGYWFYADGSLLWNYDQGLSKRGEQVLLTCEVEDGTWAGYVPAGGYGSLASSATHMDVDWVRVWAPGP